MEVIPVRRDGTGRLVAVGLIEVEDSDGGSLWTTIHAAEMAGEAFEQAIARALVDTLGPDVQARRSPPSKIAAARPMLWRRDSAFHRSRGVIDDACAVEISGTVAPRGAARRFTWFIVTALPPQRQIGSDVRPILAEFLQAQEEPGLAARLIQF